MEPINPDRQAPAPSPAPSNAATSLSIYGFAEGAFIKRRQSRRDVHDDLRLPLQRRLGRTLSAAPARAIWSLALVPRHRCQHPRLRRSPPLRRGRPATYLDRLWISQQYAGGKASPPTMGRCRRSETPCGWWRGTVGGWSGRPGAIGNISIRCERAQ